jgi:hypothetical protein
LWNLNAKTIADAEKAYTYMYPDNYVLSFIYSPKFTWNSSGPWINIPFRYGNLSPSKAVNAVKTTTTTTVFNRFLLTH